ncbi:MAG: response regulator [Chloroflexi bacterium]|nr:response regulator [Chloroflexota bacterium]
MAYLLIVEDEPDLRAVWTEALNLLGNRVQSAADGDEALELALKQSFDLILLDLNLPRRNGLSVLKEIRERDDQTPIVVVTAASDSNQVRLVVAAGATDVLFKPLPMDTLIDAISRLARQTGR